MALAIGASTLPPEGPTPPGHRIRRLARSRRCRAARRTPRLHFAIAALQALALSVQHGSIEGAPEPWIFDPDTHMLPKPNPAAPLPPLVRFAAKPDAQSRNPRSLSFGGYWSWVREQDLNLRPSGYEPDELPGCSIPRQGGE